LAIVQAEEAAVGINITLQSMLPLLSTPLLPPLLERLRSGGRRFNRPIWRRLEYSPNSLPATSVNFEGWNDPAYTAILQ